MHAIDHISCRSCRPFVRLISYSHFGLLFLWWTSNKFGGNWWWWYCRSGELAGGESSWWRDDCKPRRYIEGFTEWYPLKTFYLFSSFPLTKYLFASTSGYQAIISWVWAWYYELSIPTSELSVEARSWQQITQTRGWILLDIMWNRIK